VRGERPAQERCVGEKSQGEPLTSYFSPLTPLYLL
jgi:hypothetical protein